MFTRRQVLQSSAAGFGWLAFSALHAQWTAKRSHGAEPTKYRSPLAPKPQHFAAKAKRVIFFFMAGGPSHLDTFDWKPELAKRGPGGRSQHLAPVFGFQPSGKSGLPIADVFPHLAKHADHLCLLNGVHTAVAGHQQATVAVHTGNPSFVRPSFGSWITYGLGSQADDLPGFVTLNPLGDQGGAQNYGSAFLPAAFQGTRLGTGSRGVPNIENRHLAGNDQRKQLDFVEQANRRLLEQDPNDPALQGLIESYELAYKMQTSVPATLDLERESAATHSLYGLDDAATSAFGTQCLTARRLAEKGVRFIQLTSQGWDHHNNLRESLGRNATSIDKPIAGLIADLAQRGMLDETLLVWGGEFGRTARDDKGDGNGRGHANKGYTMWMCGGGVKGGLRYGATDELGEVAVDGRMGTHDLHATILHLLGLNHEELTYRYAGRDFRLTDTAGEAAKGIVA
ncbi:hypothetical protein ETAA8_51590 [Anatilimnocola aggregata]|uniref:DUF1501 domain-containing protein n=1 Tax=Anatilimnocola aggregata TaxID=2528021 RepID=A0A517YIK5_9BACT|nr:DUF1501 domain-containing protein [Anatilimnocola aggregata]QDU30041.1 hypothetical protein ETAA8_51590 [Anatilimnocola aggregata]